MLKRVVLLMAVAAFIAGMACSSSSSSKKSITIPVQVDGKADGFVGAFTAYFPNQVQAHAGDEVDFTEVFSGEPHTVTLGKALDNLFALAAQACPNGGPSEDPACQNGPPPEFADRAKAANAKLPPLIPDDLTQPLNQAATQPCFLATGNAPTDNKPCSADQMTQPAFDGTQTFYNSGYLEDAAVFKVKLTDNIAPGTYNFFCLLHRESMSGTITVVDKGTDVPSPSDVKAKGDTALSDVSAKIKPEFDKLASLTADTAQAGALSQDAQNGLVAEFGPKEISIPVGGSVTWTVLGPHTMSFNAPESARPILKKDAGGNWEINKETISPAPEGAPGQPAPDPNAPPPAANAPPTLIDAGNWDGQGFRSSGFFFSFPPALFQYKLTFTTAGTYTYICLIHPDMKGTVKVG